MAARLGERGRVYALFALVTLACALGNLSQTAVNSMLLGIGAEFAVDASVSQWLTTAYMLVMGITVPTVAFLTRRLGTRRLFLLAQGVFFAGSIACMAAPAFAVLLVGRVLQGIASGIMLPFVQSIAMTRFPPGQNGTAMGIAGIALGFAPNVGPIMGGIAVESWGWRSFFALLVVLLALLLAATVLLVARDDEGQRSAAPDALSLVLSTLGFGGLLLAFSNASSMSVGSPLVWAPLVAGALFLAMFVARQNRIERPLIDLRVFRVPSFRVGFVVQNLLYGSFLGITLVVPLFVMGPCGGTAVDAGLVFVPAIAVALIFNPLAGALSDRLGARMVVLVSTCFLLAGSILMTLADESTPLWMLMAMNTVRAVGVSASIGPITAWSLAGLPREIMIDGSAFSATVRQACGALGTAVMVLLIALASGGDAAGGLTAGVLGCRLAFGFAALLAAGMLVTTWWKVR